MRKFYLAGHKEQLCQGTSTAPLSAMCLVCKSLPWDPAVLKSPDGALHTDLKVFYINVRTSMAFEEITMIFL